MGIYMSVILRPGCKAGELMHLTCAAGVCMCDAIEGMTGFRPRIKWINDLIANGKKLRRLEFDNALRGKYRIYLTMKIELSGKSKGVAMTANVWESANRWVRRAKAMDAVIPENPGKGYEIYKLGEANFLGSYDVQMPQASDPAIKNLWIDRVILVPVK
jgi:hypothetical protein